MYLTNVKLCDGRGASQGFGTPVETHQIDGYDQHGVEYFSWNIIHV